MVARDDKLRLERANICLWPGVGDLMGPSLLPAGLRTLRRLSDAPFLKCSRSTGCSYYENMGSHREQSDGPSLSTLVAGRWAPSLPNRQAEMDDLLFAFSL